MTGQDENLPYGEFRDALIKTLKAPALTITSSGATVEFPITENHSKLDIVAMRLAEAAIVKSDMSAIKEIADRLDGKSLQPTYEMGRGKTVNLDISPALKSMLMGSLPPPQQKRLQRVIDATAHEIKE